MFCVPAVVNQRGRGQHAGQGGHRQEQVGSDGFSASSETLLYGNIVKCFGLKALGDLDLVRWFVN